MLQLYVAQERSGWLDASGQAHWYEDGDFDDRMERCFMAAAEGWPGRGLRRTPVKVWVSGELIRPFLLGPMAGLKGTAEIRSFAQSRVTEATGWDELCEVRVDGDVTQQVALATAMPSDVHARLEARVQHAKLRLVSLRPWWAGMLDQATEAQPELELLVVEEPASLTLLAAEQGNWSMVEVLAPKPMPEEVSRAVRRLVAGGSVQQGRAAWLCLSLTSSGDLDVGKPWPAARPRPFERQS